MYSELNVNDLDLVIARLSKRLLESKESENPELAQVIERIKRKQPTCKPPNIDPGVIERLTLDARRLRRLNDAQQDYPLPEYRPASDALNPVIERLRNRTSIVDEADLLIAQTFALPRRGRYEPLDRSDADYEAVRMEMHVHNEWCDKLVKELKNINLL